MIILNKLGLVDPEKVAQHREVWTTFARALVQARRIRPDGADGEGGTYVRAAEALEWLLSADAYLYLQTIKAELVLAKALDQIGYKTLFRRIGEAARESSAGRNWMANDSLYPNLERFVNEVEASKNSIIIPSSAN